MAIVIPPRPRLVRNDPLLKGLIFDVPLNSKSGLYLPVDLVTGIKATSGGTGSKSQKVGKYGWSVDFNNTGQYFNWAAHPNASSYSYLTFEIILVRESGGNGGGYGAWTGLRDSADSTDWFSAGNDNFDGGWGIRYNCFYDNREKVWSTAYPTNNLWHHYIVRYDHTNKDNTPDVWQNITKLGLTNRFDSAWTKSLQATDIFIANPGTGTGSSWDGQIALVRWWKRLLTNQEIGRLLSSPITLYRTSPIYFFGKSPIATNTKTFTVDGIVKQIATETFTVDGIVKATQIETFTVDGVIKEISTETFTIDGIVLAHQEATFTIDGIVQSTEEESFTVDGIVKAITTEEFTVDGLVKAVGAETFTVDGIVLAVTDETFTIDGLVQATQTETFTIDGIVLEVNTETFTVDGLVLAVQTESFTIDGIVRATQDQTFTIDGLVRATQTEEFTVDGIVLAQATEVFTVDGIVSTRLSEAFTIDGLVRPPTSYYSRSEESSLPTDDALLDYLFEDSDYTDVATSDDTYEDQTHIGGYPIFQFRDKNVNNTSSIRPYWEGKSLVAPSVKAVHLQIYNRVSGLWETIDTDSTTAAGTDFVLEAAVTEDVNEYYDSNYWVACRVYQEI